jgi:hypothetical protein
VAARPVVRLFALIYERRHRATRIDPMRFLAKRPEGVSFPSVFSRDLTRLTRREPLKITAEKEREREREREKVRVTRVKNRSQELRVHGAIKLASLGNASRRILSAVGLFYGPATVRRKSVLLSGPSALYGPSRNFLRIALLRRTCGSSSTPRSIA